VRPRWRLEARIAYDPRRVQSETLVDPPGAYGRFFLVAGTVAGCLTHARPAFEVGPCADAEIGVVRGDGVGVAPATSHTSPWLGVGAGGFLALKANPWLAFSLHIDAIVPLWRPHYVFKSQDTETPIFRAWSVGGRLTAGAELRF